MPEAVSLVVLLQLAAVSDVQHLHAAADAEYGQVCLVEDIAQESDLLGVADDVDRIGLLDDIFAVEPGSYVVATGDEQAVQGVNEFLDVLLIQIEGH